MVGTEIRLIDQVKSAVEALDLPCPSRAFELMAFMEVSGDVKRAIGHLPPGAR
jgi:hypothetical protein